MAHSMTAFAHLSQSTEFGNITCEIRSVNSRFLDQNIYLPDIAKYLEQDISNLVKNKVKRGKLELKLFISASPNLENIEINQDLASNLIEILQSLKVQMKDKLNLNTSIELTKFLQYPNLLINKQNISNEFEQTCLAIISATLDELVQVRKTEGDKLTEFILEKAYLAREHLTKIEELGKDSTKNLYDKLNAKILSLQTGIDETKLAQEVAFLVQKSDITEEIDRIKTHLIALDKILQQDEPIGRKLDFLVQELQREVNTLSSKAHKVEMSNLAIEIKVINEQIREQAQNLE